MNSLRSTQTFCTSSKVYIAKSILFSLVSIIGLVSIVSIQGCADKATEIHDRECANMMGLVNEKKRTLDLKDRETAEATMKEMTALLDQYSIKCKKKKQ